MSRLADDGRDESYRAVLTVRDVDGNRAQLLILRRGIGGNARVWLCPHGALRYATLLDAAMLAELAVLLADAGSAR